MRGPPFFSGTDKTEGTEGTVRVIAWVEDELQPTRARCRWRVAHRAVAGVAWVRFLTEFGHSAFFLQKKSIFLCC